MWEQDWRAGIKCILYENSSKEPSSARTVSAPSCMFKCVHEEINLNTFNIVPMLVSWVEYFMIIIQDVTIERN